MPSNSPVECTVSAENALRGNVQPLLHEIRHALQHWLEHGEQTIIDLRSIPMAPGEEEQILARLGRGEVIAQVSALGPSEVCETRYPGVWLVTHRNTENEITGRYIEITEMPDILESQQQDMQESLQRLAAELSLEGEGGDDQGQSETMQ